MRPLFRAAWENVEEKEEEEEGGRLRGKHGGKEAEAVQEELRAQERGDGVEKMGGGDRGKEEEHLEAHRTGATRRARFYGPMCGGVKKRKLPGNKTLPQKTS